ncbi:MAG: hypothetical protein Kow0010_18940 [Dehalococcoidia bacterium]
MPLTLARELARNRRPAPFTIETDRPGLATRASRIGFPGPPSQSNASATAAATPSGPHTPVRSYSDAGPDSWDDLLVRMGNKYNVPWLFLKAVMLAESGGRADAVGDDGHSVGLFQLHDQGYGHGMGDARYDPEINADRGARGLAASWHKVIGASPITEAGVRDAYDDTFNPGGGWAYQGDAVVRHYNALLAERGLPPLS